MDLGHRDDKIVERVMVARHDGLDRLHHRDRRRDRIGRLVRHRAMPAAPLDRDRELVHRRHDRPRRGQHAAQLQPRRIVQGVDLGDVEPVHHALVDHDARAAAILFGGLENQRDLAPERPRLSQVGRRPQKHRGVPVMPAGMHRARDGRGVGHPPSPLSSAARPCRHAAPPRGPAPAPRSTATMPVFAMPSWISSTPISRSRAATKAAVPAQSKAISGWACRCRRHSVICGASPAIRLMTGMSGLLASGSV